MNRLSLHLPVPHSWDASDLTRFKTGSILFGAAVGLFLPKGLRGLAPLLLAGAAALCARPVLKFLKECEAGPEPEASDRTPAGENL